MTMSLANLDHKRTSSCVRALLAAWPQRALLSYVIMLVITALSMHGAVSWYDILDVANNTGFALHMWQCGMQL